MDRAPTDAPRLTTPTLQDVAARAGVSTATVSRALNFPDRVAAATRDRVMQAVADLGYSPNFGARAMAARRTNTIGAIIPTMENAIFARGLQAFQDGLRAEGFTLLVASSAYSAAEEEEQIRTLVARGADGLLLIGHERDRRIRDFLDARGIPALVTWAFDPDAAHPSVGFDNRAAMRTLADRAIEMGHSRLAMISADTVGNDRAAERVAGVREAMAAAGLDAADLTVIVTPYGIDNGGRALAQLMARDRVPTVVLCGNDVLAVGALRQARLMGLDVPGDLSITGFDDIELAQVAVPELTTVHVPHRKMGAEAARVLARMVRDGAPAEAVKLPADLRMRASLAPPRARRGGPRMWWPGASRR
ncbi:LacI family DNA-binding transcriptional regulator [Jannaschia rubra]|uniref:LacI family DNA-binding transcriptional regulator n=1 Tax=Jannaschia rubra TaxID=282197 RepID=UPI0024902890|nr:LacI family DNA-binding transcriptional regulator [Jannaschia rubra]